LEDFVLIQLSKLVKEVLIENAVNSFPDFVQVFPLIRNQGIRERHCLFFYFDHLIGKVNLAVASHQHNFVKVSSSVGYVRWFPFYMGLQPEKIKMPYVISDGILHPMEFPSIKFL
jgi:hypothetical protein